LFTKPIYTTTLTSETADRLFSNITAVSALFYYSETDRNTVIFMDKMDVKLFHALQTMIPKYLPSLFKDCPLTDSETKVAGTNPRLNTSV
jgi:hypothetical protein